MVKFWTNIEIAKIKNGSSHWQHPFSSQEVGTQGIQAALWKGVEKLNLEVSLLLFGIVTELLID